MVKLKCSILAVLSFFLVGNINAQSTDSLVNGISVKAFLTAYEVLQSEDPLALRQYNTGVELGYHRVLTHHIQLFIPLRVTNLKFADSTSNIRSLGIDVQGQYHFNEGVKNVNPYISAGLGYTFSGDYSHIGIPLGAGLDFKLSPTALIGLKADYRLGLESNRSAVQFSIGFKKWLGRGEKKMKEKVPEEEYITDADGDGIEDELDLCPNEAGLAEHNGCPDIDEDGVADYEDKCPEVPGTEEFDGCPDTDNDGVPDIADECPSLVGPIDNNGCPESGGGDRDGDGVADAEDRCPDEVGPIGNRGCPDSDGDGVPDIDDLCPSTVGAVDNYGCPEIKEQERTTLNVAMESVQFETGKAQLKSQSFNILDQVAGIMKKYPDYHLRITGHTDNVGSETNNLNLSENRARSCYEYLASRGVSVNRMSYVGMGESQPRADNNSEAGRYKNRRVEFSIYIPR